MIYPDPAPDPAHEEMASCSETFGFWCVFSSLCKRDPEELQITCSHKGSDPFDASPGNSSFRLWTPPKESCKTNLMRVALF